MSISIFVIRICVKWNVLCTSQNFSCSLVWPHQDDRSRGTLFSAGEYTIFTFWSSTWRVLARPISALNVRLWRFLDRFHPFVVLPLLLLERVITLWPCLPATAAAINHCYHCPISDLEAGLTLREHSWPCELRVCPNIQSVQVVVFEPLSVAEGLLVDHHD